MLFLLIKMYLTLMYYVFIAVVFFGAIAVIAETAQFPFIIVRNIAKKIADYIFVD